MCTWTDITITQAHAHGVENVHDAKYLPNLQEDKDLSAEQQKLMMSTFASKLKATKGREADDECQQLNEVFVTASASTLWLALNPPDKNRDQLSNPGTAVVLASTCAAMTSAAIPLSAPLGFHYARLMNTLTTCPPFKSFMWGESLA